MNYVSSIVTRSMAVTGKGSLGRIFSVLFLYINPGLLLPPQSLDVRRSTDNNIAQCYNVFVDGCQVPSVSSISTPIIFISYRRGEEYPDEHVARGLHDSLAAEFGPDALFRDVNDSHQMISRNFRDALIDVINQSTVCVVVIGPKWIDDIQRLHNQDDFVRMEILEFLRRPGVGVIPVTVGGATFPNKTELPAVLRGLVDYGGVAISNDSAQNSTDQIVAAIKTRESYTNGQALENKSNYPESSSKGLQSKQTNLLRTIFKPSIAIIVAGILGWLIHIVFFKETYDSCLMGGTMAEKIECHEKYGQS